MSFELISEDSSYDVVRTYLTTTDRNLSFQDEHLRLLTNYTISDINVYLEDALFDEHGRRLSESSNDKSNTRIDLFGGSFAYGAGLKTNQTLQHMLEDEGSFEVENYGLSGGSANSMLYIIEGNDIKRLKDVQNALYRSTDAKNIAIYYFIPDHVYRESDKSVASLSLALSYPRYYFSENGSLQQGFFYSRDPEYFFTPQNIFSLLNLNYRRLRAFSSFLSGHAPVHIRGELNDEDIRLFFSVVNESRNIYESRTGGEFIVLISPLYYDSPLTEKFIDSLDDSGIRYLNYNYVDDRNDYIIPRDGHPNEYHNEILSEKMIDSLSSYTD